MQVRYDFTDGQQQALGGTIGAGDQTTNLKFVCKSQIY